VIAKIESRYQMLWVALEISSTTTLMMVRNMAETTIWGQEEL